MRTIKNVLAKAVCTILTVSMTAGMIPGQAEAASAPGSIPTYHTIPAYQYKDIFAEERVTVDGIAVEEVTDDSADPVETVPIERPVTFTVFNSTKQEVEQTVQSENGMLPALKLIKDHNYIIFSEDDQYWMRNVYLWVKDGQPVDIKCDPDLQPNGEYPEIKSIQMYDGAKKDKIAEAEKRIFMNLDVLYGTGNMYNINFKLVSDVETIEVSSGNSGKLRAELLEDVTYTLVVDNSQYTVDTFPIVGKDKSEYKYQNNKELGRYFYDHSSCKRVYEIQLIKKEDAHKNDMTVTSLSGDTTVTGYNFKDLLIVDRKLDKSQVSGLEGKDADVIDIKAVNPHRWEISKLAAGEFQVTEKIPAGKQVENVSYINAEGELENLAFEQNGDAVSFGMNSLSLHPVVIEYKKMAVQPTRPSIKISKITIGGISKKIAAGKKIQLTAQAAPSNVSNKAVTWTTSNKKYATVSSTGKVTTKKAGAGKTVTITATAKDGSGKKAAYKIKIMKNAVKSIKLKAAKSVKAGKKLTVKATVKTTGKSVNKTLKWTSSNTKYATVNSKGKVTAKKAGKGKAVKIKAAATDGSGKTKTIKIKIK